MTKEWLFEDEVVKTKVLYPKKERDPSYNPSTFVAPGDVDLAYFPQTRRGRVLASGREADWILEQLQALPELTQPPITLDMWQVRVRNVQFKLHWS